MAINYEARAKAWFDRALSEGDEFVKFILFYISLEVLVREKQGKMRDLKQNTRLKGIFFHSVPNIKINELKKELDAEPLRNMNPSGDNRWLGKLESVNDFAGIIEFIIRARNNLFHGDKGLDIKRDLFIIKWGNFLLEPLCGAFLNGKTKK